MRLARVFHKIDARSARLFRSHGLNTAQFDVLARLGASAGMTQQELADALLVTKGNISQLLDRMERDGLVTRQQEGRSNCLYLTERGHALRDRALPQQEAQIGALLAPLTAEEQRTLLRLLRKLDRGID